MEQDRAGAEVLMPSVDGHHGSCPTGTPARCRDTKDQRLLRFVVCTVQW